MTKFYTTFLVAFVNIWEIAVINRMGLFLVVTAMFAMTAGMAEAQSVVDARGRMVGTLLQAGEPKMDNVWAGVVLRFVSAPLPLTFSVNRAGLVAAYGGPSEILYSSTDCSGAGYLRAPQESLHEGAAFLSSDPNANGSTRGKLIYRGSPELTLTVASSRGIGRELGGCNEIDAQSVNVRPVVELDISSWGLRAPFRIR